MLIGNVKLKEFIVTPVVVIERQILDYLGMDFINNSDAMKCL